MNSAVEIADAGDSRSWFRIEGEPETSYHVLPFATRTEHLNVRFEDGNRVGNISQILESCLSASDGALSPNESLGWSLPHRLQGMLAILRQTLSGTLMLTILCPLSECRQPMELELSLSQFVSPVPPNHLSCELADGRCLSIRLPTGLDQLDWLRGRLEGRQLEAQMAQTLVQAIDGLVQEGDWTLPEEWLDAIGEVLERHDPLNAPFLQTQCPNCGEEVVLPLDLEGLVLEQLAQEQRRVMRQVHELARAYHWTEGEVLQIPSWRREQYLSWSDRGDWL